MLERYKALQAFYDSPRFQEILTLVAASDAIINQENVAYYPDRYPFTAKEFSDFCNALFHVHRQDVREDFSGSYPAATLTVKNVEVTIMIGQGSVYFARKAPASGPAATPPAPSF